VWTSPSSSVEVANCFYFVRGPPCGSAVCFGLACGTSLEKTTLTFLAARAVPASSSLASELARLFFLGGIMGLVFIAQMVGVKCWVPTRGQVGLST
jgi:hypothetical protein